MHRLMLLDSPQDLGFQLAHNTTDPGIDIEAERRHMCLFVAGVVFILISFIGYIWYDILYGQPNLPPPTSAAAAAINSGGHNLRLSQVFSYGSVAREMMSTTECSICLGEFSDGEKVRVLPECNHGFHVVCIDGWLALHSSCPNCRHSVAAPCPRLPGN